MNTKCCVSECEKSATVFTNGLSLCPRHYLEMDKEQKTLMFKAEYFFKERNPAGAVEYPDGSLQSYIGR